MHAKPAGASTRYVENRTEIVKHLTGLISTNNFLITQSPLGLNHCKHASGLYRNTISHGNTMHFYSFSFYSVLTSVDNEMTQLCNPH